MIKMLSMFGDLEIIENLKTIVNAMEENNKNKQIIYTYIRETGKYAIECNCEQGINRLQCSKCKGTGYYLVEKEGE